MTLTVVVVLDDLGRLEALRERLQAHRPAPVRIETIGSGQTPLAAVERLQPATSRRRRQRSMARWLMPFGFLAGVTFTQITDLQTFSALGSWGEPVVGGLLGMVSGLMGSFAPAHALEGDCGQPKSKGANPVASDCLFILKAAVGSATCDRPCICEVRGGSSVKASDALFCLKKSVGQSVALTCPCGTPDVQSDVNYKFAPSTDVKAEDATVQSNIRSKFVATNYLGAFSQDRVAALGDWTAPPTTISAQATNPVVPVGSASSVSLAMDADGAATAGDAHDIAPSCTQAISVARGTAGAGSSIHGAGSGPAASPPRPARGASDPANKTLWRSG